MTPGSLTILQLTHQGVPAGSTQSIFDLGQHLARRGHRVLVGCRADVLLARLARDAGLPVVPLSFLPRGVLARALEDLLARERVDVDRKSTRLNSSHSQISYAVFCLKKKNNHFVRLYSYTH